MDFTGGDCFYVFQTILPRNWKETHLTVTDDEKSLTNLILLGPLTDCHRKGVTGIMLASHCMLLHCNYQYIIMSTVYFCLQCFDAVGWAAGRASGL